MTFHCKQIQFFVNMSDLLGFILGNGTVELDSIKILAANLGNEYRKRTWQTSLPHEPFSLIKIYISFFIQTIIFKILLISYMERKKMYLTIVLTSRDSRD